MKIFKARPFRITNLAITVKRTLAETGSRALDDYKGTIQHFEEISPTFKLTRHDGGFRVVVKPDNDHDGEIYNYVDIGTRVRYATMSPKFRPKTIPNTLRTGPGHPPIRPLFVDRNNPQPGIAARGYSDLIAKNRGGQCIKGITSALDRM